MVKNKLVCTVSPSKISLKIKQNYFCFAFKKGWVLSKGSFAWEFDEFIYLYLYEHLLSASSRDEPQVLHNGNYSTLVVWVSVALHSMFWISTKVVAVLF